MIRASSATQPGDQREREQDGAGRAERGGELSGHECQASTDLHETGIGAGCADLEHRATRGQFRPGEDDCHPKPLPGHDRHQRATPRPPGRHFATAGSRRHPPARSRPLIPRTEARRRYETLVQELCDAVWEMDPALTRVRVRVRPADRPGRPLAARRCSADRGDVAARRRPPGRPPGLRRLHDPAAQARLGRDRVPRVPRRRPRAVAAHAAPTACYDRPRQAARASTGSPPTSRPAGAAVRAGRRPSSSTGCWSRACR